MRRCQGGLTTTTAATAATTATAATAATTTHTATTTTATTATTTTTYPTPSSKVRLQMQAALPAEAAIYNGPLHAVRRIVAEEGLFASWGGLWTPGLVASSMREVVST